MDTRWETSAARLFGIAGRQGRERRGARETGLVMAKTSQLAVNGRNMTVSNLDKIFYPKTGFTKGNVIDFYIRISPVLLPHLKDRPITLKRYPNGVEGGFFYEKQCPVPGRPKSVKTTKVPKSDGSEVNYCVMNDLSGLLWAANLADLELHTFLHKAPGIDRPTSLAFDLDPGAPADIITCCKVALQLKTVLDALKLKSFAKTSGSKGLQIYVPLNNAITYEKTKPFARGLAGLLEKQTPDLVLSNMRKDLRASKVFMDWSQNDAHKTTVNVYSLRAKERPTVSTPVSWEEIETAQQKKKATLLQFETEDVLTRVEKLGDLFAPVLTLKQKLPRLESLARE
jgi:bifunctional non-homologous end joining protein LigD